MILRTTEPSKELPVCFFSAGGQRYINHSIHSKSFLPFWGENFVKNHTRLASLSFPTPIIQKAEAKISKPLITNQINLLPAC